ncbi:hypothetical protein AHAS_Ahas11G0045800 [Arachis hypogaea]
MPDVPDNRRVAMTSWYPCYRPGVAMVDDMIQDDRSGDDGVGHGDHRVRRGRLQRRGGSSGGTSVGPSDRPPEHDSADEDEDRQGP